MGSKKKVGYAKHKRIEIVTVEDDSEQDWQLQYRDEQNMDARQVLVKGGGTLLWYCGFPFSIHFLQLSPFPSTRYSSRPGGKRGMYQIGPLPLKQTSAAGIYEYFVAAFVSRRVNGKNKRAVVTDDPDIIFMPRK